MFQTFLFKTFAYFARKKTYAYNIQIYKSTDNDN